MIPIVSLRRQHIYYSIASYINKIDMEIVLHVRYNKDILNKTTYGYMQVSIYKYISTDHQKGYFLCTIPMTQQLYTLAYDEIEMHA